MMGQGNMSGIGVWEVCRASHTAGSHPVTHARYPDRNRSLEATVRPLHRELLCAGVWSL